MRMQRYYLTDMSEKGREALPGVLDEWDTPVVTLYPSTALPSIPT